ncbi:MAG: hypothetical protein ACREBG_17570 [Pyrinomonadaceae bacterium]
MIHNSKIIRYGLAGVVLGLSLGGMTFASAQTQQTDEAKPAAATKRVRDGGRDPFRKYEPPRVLIKRIAGQLMVPTIQERIAQYRAQKVAAMNARMIAPKPTTALLLSEMQVIGVSRTPRGYAAIVEATPIKLSYVIYPGERFYDGQLVAIEENRLIFRRETVFVDGRRERSVEVKSLRQPNTADLMTTAKAVPSSAPAADSGKISDQPAAAPNKP